MEAPWCLDPVSIAPIPAGKLGVVVEYELVGARDQIEISLPGDIAGLEDGDPAGHPANLLNR
jgi:hypothetical protein